VSRTEPLPSGRRPSPEGIRVAHVATIDLTLKHLLLPQLARLREEGYEVTAISRPGTAAADLRAAGIRFIPWPHATRSWDPAADLRAFAELLAIFRRERFHLVHTHNPKPGVIGRLAGRRASVPCVVNTVHGLYTVPEDPAARRLPVLATEWLAARFSDLELYQSEEDLRWVRRLGLADGRRIALLGNGIDLGRFDPRAIPPEREAALRAELDIPEGAPVVGTVGRLVAEKGYRELFAAAHRVRQRFPDARFLVVGPFDPAKWDALGGRDLAEAGGHIVFTGWREDVPELLALMDVFVLASWREGLPRSAIEAAAMGRPTVLTAIRGCREVVRDGQEGLLVPARDPERLAQAIERLLGSAELRARLGAAGRARAETRFDQRLVLDRLVNEYGRLLERKGLLSTEYDLDGLGRIRIRRGRTEEARLLARFHARTHPAAFLPILGVGFLTQLYRALLEQQQGVALVAERDGAVVGFATGVLSMSDFYRRFMARHGTAAVISALPRLARPGVARRVLETLRYPVDAQGLPEAEFSTLAVTEGLRSRHLGGLLSRAVIDALAGLGATAVRGTVNITNGPMNRMMTRIGFEKVGQTVLHDGIPSNQYVIQCRSSSPSASRS
jgi:glycosyltransferase involved in cell wall biosynthesis